MRYFLPIILAIFCITLPLISNAGDLLEDEISVNRQNRSMLVYHPQGADLTKNTQKLPLVIALHGAGGNGLQFMQASGIDRFADKHNFIAVFPNGKNKLYNQRKMLNWDTQDCCKYRPTKPYQDVDFIERIIDKLVEEYNADKNKVYLVGHSKGARLAYLAACRLGNSKITAIGTNAINIPDYTILGQCENKVPVMHSHGAQDRCIPFAEERNCGGCLSETYNFNGANFLKNANNSYCYPITNSINAMARTRKCEAREVFEISKNIFCNISKNCEDGASVSLCAFQNAGHTWAGGKYGKVCDNPKSHLCKKYKDITGEINNDINLMDLYWGFFTSLEKKI